MDEEAATVCRECHHGTGSVSPGVGAVHWKTRAGRNEIQYLFRVFPCHHGHNVLRDIRGRGVGSGVTPRLGFQDFPVFTRVSTCTGTGGDTGVQVRVPCAHQSAVPVQGKPSLWRVVDAVQSQGAGARAHEPHLKDGSCGHAETSHSGVVHSGQANGCTIGGQRTCPKLV